MYRNTRHGIVEPVNIKLLLRRLLLVAGLLLVIATIILAVQWWRTFVNLRSSPNQARVCNGPNFDLPGYACGPQQPPYEAWHGLGALATGISAAGFLLGTHLLGRQRRDLSEPSGHPLRHG